MSEKVLFGFCILSLAYKRAALGPRRERDRSWDRVHRVGHVDSSPQLDLGSASRTRCLEISWIYTTRATTYLWKWELATSWIDRVDIHEDHN